MTETIKLRNLETLRRANGLTVDKLLTAIGRNCESDCRNIYYNWQKTGQVKVSDLIKLHEFFGVSVDCLLDLAPLTITG